MLDQLTDATIAIDRDPNDEDVRRAAIAAALERAKPGDAVLVASGRTRQKDWSDENHLIVDLLQQPAAPLAGTT